MNLDIKTVTGPGIKPFLSDIARLRIKMFREFPYLYDGDQNYEKRYLETYVRSNQSVAILVFHGERIVGVSTGIPLTDETEEFQNPFREQNFRLAEFFYCGESLLLPKFRGRGIYKIFFRAREEHALRLGQFNKTCFCAVIRDDDHPLRPGIYQPLDPAWKSYGYRKQPNLTTCYSWKDINQPEENEKTMVFWIKDLQN